MRVTRWAYGVTTVPERRDTLLPRTLRSLADAGFDHPRLFVDGSLLGEGSWTQEFSLAVTAHNSRLGAYGNWILALWELLIREPLAHRYAIFQDDLLSCRNLRQYLERAPYPEKGYWNLYTFPHPYQQEPPRGADGRYREGWFESNQRGRGAVGLVFSRDAVTTLLHHAHMVLKPVSASRPRQCIDGAVSEAMRDMRWTEYVHYPSLLQHTGEQSVIGNSRHAQADSFRGEDFDALTILETVGCR